MSPEQANAWLQLGGGALVLLALVLGWKKVWVFGWLYTQTEQERDEWRRLYLKGLDVTNTAMNTTLTPDESRRAQDIIRGSDA